MKIAARAKAAQPFHAMSIGERAGSCRPRAIQSPSSAWASRTSVLLLLSAKRCAA